jgi:hypothetical protein
MPRHSIQHRLAQAAAVAGEQPGEPPAERGGGRQQWFLRTGFLADSFRRDPSQHHGDIVFVVLAE